MDRRVAFDFDIEFTNGGGLQGQDFRLDVPGEDVTDAWIGDALVRDLRLLMVGDVRIPNRRVLEEPHKRGLEPAAVGGAAPAARRLVDLSHPIIEGMTTYPGLPGARDPPAPHPRGEHRPLRTRRDLRDRRHRRCAATPGRTSTARSTASPTGRISPSCRSSGSSTCRRCAST